MVNSTIRSLEHSINCKLIVAMILSPLDVKNPISISRNSYILTDLNVEVTQHHCNYQFAPNHSLECASLQILLFQTAQ